MKIAVTAASGQLGAAIVKALIPEVGKENIIAIARTPENARHLGVETRKGDYNNREDFDKALSGVEKVLLVSGMDEPQKRIQQHRNVIDAARKNGLIKIVYTSIIGNENETEFSSIVKSNRQTEADVRASGLSWAIGRNGIYIEPDLEYIDKYVKAGEISNCAGDGKCGYTSRSELAFAYANLLLNDDHNGQTFNLSGKAITQSQLATYINQVFGTELRYRPLSVSAYKKERQAALGEFLGTVISGIYEGIQKGVNDVPSDYEAVTGRPHKDPVEMLKAWKANNS
ncbi:MAG: SDR family oxidoreductase [Bacteroidetes bacterium]|nr:SDR family oxidoreductase [Bacteroidota bacterium]